MTALLALGLFGLMVVVKSAVLKVAFFILGLFAFDAAIKPNCK